MTIPNRSSTNSMTTRVLSDLQRTMNRGQKLQGEISSGKQISRPSDSPTGTVTSLQLRTEVRATQQYSRNADDGLGWLGTIQDKLQDASTNIINVRNLTIQAMSSADNVQSKDALVAQIDQIKQQMISDANSKYMDRPIFGGATAGTIAFDGTGAFVGDSNKTTRTVGPNAKIEIDTNGTEAFGENGSPSQLFAVLTDISDKIKKGDTTGLDDSLKNLDTAHDLVKASLSDAGARYNRVEQMKQSADDHLLSVSSQLSDIEDVDMPKAIMEFQIQQTSYQAALAASAKVIQPSLIDYLR